MLETDNSLLVVIDIQDRLSRVMSDRQGLLDAAATLIQGARALELPILWTEQSPDKLGPTVSAVAGLMDHTAPIPKTAFDCCRERLFREALDAAGRRQIVLCGIETHICICQTALSLVRAGYEVHVAADAVSSRKESDRSTALLRMRDEGVSQTCVEMILFELLQDAAHPAFRHISRLVR